MKKIFFNLIYGVIMKNLYIIFLLLISTSLAQAELRNGETDEEVIKEGIVKLLEGPSNAGRDYWLTVPPPYLVADPTNFTRFFIGASADANVRIRQENGIDMSLQVPAGTAKSFDLKPGECQPYIHNLNDNYGLPAHVHAGKGLNITSDQPIIVYVMVRYSFTSDGYLALPTHGLGTKYISTVYDAREWSTGSLPNMVCIVSPYSKNNVKFTLGGNDMTQVKVLGGKTLRPGDSHTFKMNKGDVVVLSNVEQDETLSGSLIESDKPVAFISGQYCTDIPLRVRACDYTVEMDIPMHSWGQVYNVPYMHNRDKPSILRVFARDPQTTVWRDGQELFYFSKGVGQAGGTQNSAWYETRVWPVGLELRPAVYTSDKPIYLALFNPSSQDDGKETDPFSMVLTPVEQYQNEILFATPAAGGGKNFGANYLNIIFETDENGLVPEDMMFGTVKGGGEVDWVTLRNRFGASAELMYEIGSGDDSTGVSNTPHRGRIFGHKWVILPGDGIFKIKSSTLFACYSSGVDNYDSYGFPTATALRVISKDTLPPTINWTMDCQGNVNGTTTDNPDPDPDNIRVGLAIPELEWDDIINFTGFEYDNSNFVPGTPTTAWEIKVEDPKKYARVVLVFSDRSGNVSRDTIEYYPELIELRELAADDTNGDLLLEPLGVVGLNELHTRRYEIENMSDTRTFTVKEVKLLNKTQGFKIVKPLSWNLADAFGPREKREFTVEFTTDKEGRFFDSVGVATDCNDDFYARISAETGIPGITVDDYSFQPYALSVDGNNPAVQSTVLRVKNMCDGVEGTQPLTIIGYTQPTSPEYTHTLPVIDNGANKVVLNPGEELTFRVNFAPSAVGNYPDKIVFQTENDLGCDPECILDGKAIQAGILTQEYNWEKVRINYPKQPTNQYEPLGSEVITAINTTSGEFASQLAISDIKFEGVTGPAGTNDGLNAFSFEQNFATVLPTNPMNFFKGIKIAPGQKSNQRKVYFKPTAVGKYEINYYFESNSEVKGSETRYAIQGHGVVPNMNLYYDDNGTEETNTVDFGTITAGVPTEQQVRTLTVTNEPTNTDDGDVLIITGINWGADATTDINQLGVTKNFYVDEAKMLADIGGSGVYPISLGIGESFNVDVTYYTTQADVVHTTNIVIDSDADESGVTGKFNNTLTLTGNAVRPGLNSNSVDLYSCITNPLVVDQNYVHTSGATYDNCFYYTNTGSKDVLIKNLTFTPQDGSTAGYTLTIDGVEVRRNGGTIDNYPSADNVTLASGDKMIVLLTYTPSAKYDAIPKILIMDVETDITTVEDLPAPQECRLTSNSFIRGTINLVKKDDGQDLVEPINYNTPSHRNLNYIVSLEQSPDITDAQLQELDIEVEYRKGYLTYNKSVGVSLVDAYESTFEIIGVPTTSIKFELDADRGNKYIVKETIAFKIKAIGNNFINESGRLFEVSFKTGVPNIPIGGLSNGTETKLAEELYLEGRDPGNTETVLETSITDPIGNACAVIEPPSQITMDLDPVCAMGLRPLNLSEFNNATPGLISPHPVTSRGSNIDFSLAFDSETVIQIMNSKGDVVAVIKNEKMNAGNYSIPIPVELLSNGVYFYEISSEYLNAKDKFVVEK